MNNLKFIEHQNKINQEIKEKIMYKVKIVAEITTNHYGDFKSLIMVS